eukprot:scaffold477559_cov45-Prasinocladus_malaysianus.AAC.1
MAIVCAAQGTFEPAEAISSDDEVTLGICPVGFNVSIEQGQGIVGNSTFALPISGPGYFQVLYGDSQ